MNDRRFQVRSIALHVVGLFLFLTGGTASLHAEPAFVGAEGFGAETRGGAGGKVLHVTRLDDDPKIPAEGSLRWAVQQKGPRIVRFSVAGNIRLQSPITVTEPYLTVDGSDAPGDGVCICDDSFNVRRTHDVIVRHIRIRRGDVRTLAENAKLGRKRPKGSAGLDCVSLDDSKNILFDHCSLSWSCDEIFCIVRCENVTIQWCLIAEPLANPAVHPYGDNHAFAMNCSASTLSIHHCLIARYVMRGPQFEANDVRKNTGHDVKMEAINNVLFDFGRSGSRYSTGIEDHPDEAEGRSFAFQFLNNTYVDPTGKKPAVEAITKHGAIDRVRVAVSGNVVRPARSGNVNSLDEILTDERQPLRAASETIRNQVTDGMLFATPIPVKLEPTADAYERVLSEAGCDRKRDAVDARIVDDVRNLHGRSVVKSQADVGGWPDLK